MLALVVAVGAPALWPALAHANVTPSAAACRAQLPAASQQFFTGCSCSGTTLLIDFQSGSNEARPNDPLCQSTASTPTPVSDPSPNPSPAPDQSPTATGTSAEGESTYTVTQQTSGSGVDDWLDAVDMDFGPTWATSQTGRFNNRSLPNQQANARLAEIARELARLRAELAENQRAKEANRAELEGVNRIIETARQAAREAFADTLFGDLRGQAIADRALERNGTLPAQRALLQTSLQLIREAGNLTQQIDALVQEQHDLQTADPGLFRSPVTNGFAASGAPDWAASHGTQDRNGPWRHFSGRVSLNDVRRHMAHRRYLLAQTADGRPVADRFLIPDPAVNQRFNAWIAGSYTWSEDDRFGAEGDGGTGQITAGASYTVSETVTVGGQVRYRHMDSERNDGTASSDADGLGGSIFAQVLLPFGAIITPIVAYERTSTDLTQIIGGAPLTGGFNTDIWTFGAQAAQRFDVSNDGLGRIVWIEPTASLSYIIADRETWIRSDGIVVPADTIETGTLGFGGKIGTEFIAPAEGVAVMEPYFGINGVWAFERPADQLVTSGVLVGMPDLFAALNAGLNTVFDGGGTLSADVTFSGLGSDITSWTVGGRLTVPFGG